MKYSIDGYGLKRKAEIFSHAKSNESLEEFIVELKADPDYFPRYNWAISIVIEKHINLHELKMVDDDGKANNYEIHRHFRESYKKLAFSDAFDKILLAFLTEMEPILFDELLISEMALLIDDEIAIAFPENMGTKREGYTYCEGKAFNKEKISSLIQKMNAPKNNWLGNISHWRTSMLTEKDLWKKFNFGFICLEMFTHKSFKSILAQNKFDVIMKNGPHLNKSVKMPFGDFVPKESDCRKLPLLMKFSLVAGVLNPKNYEKDISDFTECKDFRDKMSHEGIREGDSPPLTKLDALLDFYLQTIMEKI